MAELMTPQELAEIENRPPGDRGAHAETDIKRLIAEVRDLDWAISRLNILLRERETNSSG